MRKVDLAAAYGRHADLCRQAAGFEAGCDYAASLRRAEESLAFLRDTHAYQRRFEKGAPPTADATSRILRLAPPLFARRSLDALAANFAERTKAERAALPALLEQVADARRVLAFAVQLWAALGGPADGPLPLDGAEAPALLKVWIDMGSVALVGPPGRARPVHVTDLGRSVWGKCPACGCLQQAPFAAMLDPVLCRSCGRCSPFVITRRVMQGTL